jgi:serine/threonine-protein kinase 24/25/MST4
LSSCASVGVIGRERPKFTVKGSIDATQNGQTHIEEDDYGGTIKVDRNTKHAASPSRYVYQNS